MARINSNIPPTTPPRETHRTISPTFQTIVGVALFALGLLFLTQKRDNRTGGVLMFAGSVIFITSFRRSEKSNETSEPGVQWGDVIKALFQIMSTPSGSSRSGVPRNGGFYHPPSPNYGNTNSSNMNRYNKTPPGITPGSDSSSRSSNSSSNMNPDNISPAGTPPGSDSSSMSSNRSSNMNPDNKTPPGITPGSNPSPNSSTRNPNEQTSVGITPGSG